MSTISCLTDVPHPGEFIQEELDARGWSQRDLAYILGVREQAINPIISGKRGISPEMAKALGEAFDVSADYFANLQQTYEMSLAKTPDPSIARRASLQSVYPIREMIRREWIAETDADLLEAQMMRFFRRNDIKDIPYMAHAAKKADYSETSTIQLAWLFRVRHVASEVAVSKFSEKKLANVIDGLHRWTIDPEEIRHVSKALADCGIRFVVVETLPKANIDGVCFWLDDASPVIGMTTRQDRIDNFWFVLRHELEHVLNKDGRGELRAESVDMELEKQTDETNSSLPPEETRANKAASEFCVPRADLESFFTRKHPFISERDMIGFARRVQRHPGIVVGQLQRKMDRYDWLARYKVKVREYLVGNTIMDGWGNPVPINL